MEHCFSTLGFLASFSASILACSLCHFLPSADLCHSVASTRILLRCSSSASRSLQVSPWCSLCWAGLMHSRFSISLLSGSPSLWWIWCPFGISPLCLRHIYRCKYSFPRQLIPLKYTLSERFLALGFLENIAPSHSILSIASDRLRYLIQYKHTLKMPIPQCR